MVLPAAVIAALVANAAAQGASSYFGSQQQARNAKRRSKEMKRETYASLLNDALQRNAELEGHRLSTRSKQSKARSNASATSSAQLREAFNI